LSNAFRILNVVFHALIFFAAGGFRGGIVTFHENVVVEKKRECKDDEHTDIRTCDCQVYKQGGWMGRQQQPGWSKKVDGVSMCFPDVDLKRRHIERL